MGLSRTPPETRQNSQTEEELEQEIMDLEREIENQSRDSILDIEFNHQQKDHKYAVDISKLSRNVQASIVNCDMNSEDEIKNIANLVRDSKAVSPVENLLENLTFFRGFPYRILVENLQKVLQDLEPNNIKTLEVDNKIDNLQGKLNNLSVETEQRMASMHEELKKCNR